MTRPLNKRTKYCAAQSQVLSSATQKQQVYYQISDQPGKQDHNDRGDMICNGLSQHDHY